MASERHRSTSARRADLVRSAPIASTRVPEADEPGADRQRARSAEHLRRAPNRVGDAELLTAARECVLDLGVRRSTLAEIARRARVSRMTLYRRFPDVDSLVTALMTTEFAEILHHARAAEGTGSARNRLVNAMLRCVRLLRSAPLLRRVLETDAELLLPYLVEQLGSTQLAAERFLRDYLVQGHLDGSIRRADPAAQSRALLMTLQSFVVSTGPAEAGVDPGALVDELAHLLDAALRPEAPEAP
ncbi:TetR/AcrR family transcriptional regulator [Saccharopolyspora erythraea]|uniref:TetR/AcrR family transcriptional regulator n=1 Tax=Saccharopolyspora erythraea TaxID=1836 RepID=UPI001BAA29C8|nr:TetR/AcrR family transcriptional regulator [Saccharopolyspora erythraea]QUH00001.1 TetR/AcrR family transcriptional regulator [Saccharopolyspora erythraea]